MSLRSTVPSCRGQVYFKSNSAQREVTDDKQFTGWGDTVLTGTAWLSGSFLAGPRGRLQKAVQRVQGVIRATRLLETQTEGSDREYLAHAKDSPPEKERLSPSGSGL